MRKVWISIVVTVALAACGAGEEPGGAADWRFALPDDVEIIDADPVPRTARTDLIAPRLDLEIAAAADGEPLFFSALDIAVDAAGRIYLQDVGAQDIKVFDPEGALVSVIGGPGEGPGELSPATPALTVAGGRLVLSDAILGRFTFWTLNGELEGTMVPDAGESIPGQAEELSGLEDGSYFVALESPDIAGGKRLRFLRLDRSGDVLVEFPSVPVEYTRALMAGRRMTLPVVRGRGHMAASAAGDLYLTSGDEYQVLALGADGEARWALRTDWPREPFPDNEVDRAFDSILEPMRAMGVDAVADHDSVENLPQRLPALSAIKVDGRGRLWVFPYEYWNRSQRETLGEDRMVDIYDPEGTRLFTGLVPAAFALGAGQGSSWIVAEGDHVYGVEIDSDTLEQRLVRYRLDLPF